MSAQPSQAENEADAVARAGRMADARRLLELAVTQTPERLDAWTKLAAMRRALGDLQGALDAISRALTLEPLDFSALLSKAVLIEKMGADAGEAYGNALAQRPPPEREPPALKQILVHAEARYRAHQDKKLQHLHGALQGVAGLSEEEQARLRRFSSNIARITDPFVQQPTHYHYPGMPPHEFHDRRHFPWIGDLEAALPTIRAEFDALMATEAAALVPYVQYPQDVPLRQWRALNQSRDWTAIHLLENGRTVEQNARHCPWTMELLRSLPQPRVPGQSPNAMFSLLAPKTRIPPHTGVSNTRLVCHLPLIVPPGCGFRVGAETRAWEVGKAWVFDDTIEHEAWNDSSELRVVLIFDLWSWSLSEAERQAIAAMAAANGVVPAGL